MKLFRRIARFGPWAVAAALGLDWSFPVQAAPPTALASIPVSAVAETSPEDKDAAINVQVAWLAEPGLFMCTLSAQPTTKGMELIGYVSNEPAHQKAVAIARNLCSCPVIDNIKIHNGVPMPMNRGAAPAELAATASEVIMEALGDKVLSLRITCPSTGRVEVTGTLPTIEDKLLVSKSLRLLSGCTHVINRTSAPGSSAGAAIVANVPLMMTAQVYKESNIHWKPISDLPPAAPADVAVAKAPPANTRPVVTPARSTVVKNESMLSESPLANGMPAFKPVYDKKSSDGGQRVDAAKAPAPLWPVMTNPAAQAVVTDFKPAAPKPVETVTSTPSVAQSEFRSSKQDSILSNSPPASNEVKSVEPVKEPTRVVANVPEPPKPILVLPTMPAAKSASEPMSPYSLKPIPAPPISAAADLPKPSELLPPVDMPKPVIVVPLVVPGKAAVTDLPEVAAKQETKPIESPKLEPVKSAEAVKVELPKPVSVAPAQPKTERSAQTQPTLLKPVTFAPELTAAKAGKEPISIVLDSETARRAVEDVCRGAGADLKVTAGPGRQITVGMKVGNQKEWDRVYSKVKALPEIHGYDIIYNAEVDGPLGKPALSPSPTPEVTAAKAPAPPMMGVLRSNATSSSPSAEAARTAIEKLCQGKADDLSVRAPAGRQVAVSLKVASAAEWEILYSQIKTLPEIAGCSVIYNVTTK